MSRKFTEGTLLIASGNAGKVKEIASLLSAYPIKIISAADFNLIEPDETGTSFIENAELKARYYSQMTGLPALADDSGLCVHALAEKPGIHSARWAGPNKDFIHAMHKIENLLAGDNDNSAHFTCALSLCWPDQHVVNIEGKVEGTLTFPARGTKGFGYDPIFIPDGYTKTFAELDNTEKAKISHRTDAFNKLVGLIF
jgi:XTP/dITP diphosphohydrolase